YPGDRLPYGWVGSSENIAQFQQNLPQFLLTNPTSSFGQDDPNNKNGLGNYFAAPDPADTSNTIYNGWTQYHYQLNNNQSTVFTSPPLTKIPSAQDVLADTPLANVSSSFSLTSNAYVLTSNGIAPKHSDINGIVTAPTPQDPNSLKEIKLSAG